MNGPIAQSVAIVCHGNAYRGGTRVPYFPANSTCRHCDRVSERVFRAINRANAAAANSSCRAL